MRIGLTTIAVAVISFLSVDTSWSQDDISAQVDKARTGFRPVTAEQVSAARANLAKQIADLERFVQPSTANGRKWLKFLKWDALKEALATKDAPKLEALDATLDRLNQDQNGLELRQF